MISIKVEIKGEPDVLPLTKFYEYRDEVDELLLFESIKNTKEKLSSNLKINTNEALVMYCGYIIEQLRNQVSAPNIQRNASKLLSPVDVMIGVPETLRTLRFSVALDNLTTKKISFHQPIRIVPYDMQLHLSDGQGGCSN